MGFGVTRLRVLYHNLNVVGGFSKFKVVLGIVSVCIHRYYRCLNRKFVDMPVDYHYDADGDGLLLIKSGCFADFTRVNRKLCGLRTV